MCEFHRWYIYHNQPTSPVRAFRSKYTVPKNYFKNHLPNRESIQQHRWLRPVAHWFHHPNLWHLHRRSVAGGVAVGLFCGLIPGPLQMLGAALLAVLFRVNMPIALFATLYTNPFTILPLYLLAYELGSWVLGKNGSVSAPLIMPELHWHDWFTPLMYWLTSLGQAFVIGLPLLAITLATLGYFAVRLGWRGWVLWELRKRRVRRNRIGEKP
ncbi:MAG: hypothetical protein FD173_1419 [Gallionellaceae bacterium]|nr:MAG: hypothetical protein FD173_1419 [Gallionellaceae bacterium]